MLYIAFLSYVSYLLNMDIYIYIYIIIYIYIFFFPESNLQLYNVFFWIGLNDQKQEGDFVWLDNTQKVKTSYLDLEH